MTLGGNFSISTHLRAIAGVDVLDADRGNPWWSVVRVDHGESATILSIAGPVGRLCTPGGATDGTDPVVHPRHAYRRGTQVMQLIRRPPDVRCDEPQMELIHMSDATSGTSVDLTLIDEVEKMVRSTAQMICAEQPDVPEPQTVSDLDSFSMVQVLLELENTTGMKLLEHFGDYREGEQFRDLAQFIVYLAEQQAAGVDPAAAGAEATEAAEAPPGDATAAPVIPTQSDRGPEIERLAPATVEEKK